MFFVGCCNIYNFQLSILGAIIAYKLSDLWLEGFYLSGKNLRYRYGISKGYLTQRFVGRESELNIVRSYVGKIKSNEVDLKILQIEGEDGIGKTWFLLKIKYEFEDKIPVVYVDFSDYYPRGGGLRYLLRDIAKKLREYGLETSCFDILNTVYMRVRQGTTWSKEEGIVGDLSLIAKTIPRLRRFVRSPEIIVSYGEKLQKLIKERFGEKADWFISMFGQRYGEAILGLIIEDPERYVYVMAEFLRIDILDIARKGEADIIIFLLDNYDSLQDIAKRQKEADTERPKKITDEDIMILFLMRLKRSLVLLTSRKKIEWEKRFAPLRYYIGKGKPVEKIPLERLRQEDVERYLDNLGIIDRETRELIADTVDGHPLLLSCVAGIATFSESIPIIEKMRSYGSAENIIKICINKILEYIKDPGKQALATIAVLSRFDSRTIRRALGLSQKESGVLEELRIFLEKLGFLEPLVDRTKMIRKIHRFARKAIFNVPVGENINLLKDRVARALWVIYKHRRTVDPCIEAINILIEIDEDQAFDRYLEAWDFHHNKAHYESLARLYKEIEFSKPKNVLEKNVRYAIVLEEEAKYDDAERVLLEVVKAITPTSPENLMKLGYIQYILGAMYRKIDKYDKAEEALKISIDCYKKSLNQLNETAFEARNNIGRALAELGSLYREVRRFSDAEKFLRESIEVYKEALNKINEQNPQLLSNLGEALAELGAIYRELGRYTDAEKKLREAIEAYKNSLDITEKKDPQILNKLGNALSLLGTLYKEEGIYEEAIRVFMEALEAYKDSLKRMRWRSPITWNNMGYVQSQLATIYKELRRYDDAEKVLKEAIRFYRKALALREWRIARVWSRLGAAQSELGTIYRAQRRYNEAEKAFKESIKSYKEALSLRRNDVKTLERLGAAQGELGIIYKIQRRYKDAEKMFKESIDSYEKILKFTPDNIIVLNNLGYARSMLGGIYLDQKQYSEARKLLEEAVQTYREALSLKTRGNPTILNNLGFTLTMLGVVYKELGRYRDAIKTFGEAIESYKEALGLVGWRDSIILNNLGNTQSELGSLYEELGRLEEAKRALEEAIELYKKALELSEWRDAIALNNLGTAQYLLGGIHRKQENYLEAGEILREAIDSYRKAIELTKGASMVAWSNLGSAQSLLGDVYMDLAKYKDAFRTYKEALNSFKQAYIVVEKRYYYPLFRICLTKIKICDALCMLGRCGLDDYWFALESIAEFHSKFRISEYTSFLLYMLFESIRKNKLPRNYVRLLMRRIVMLNLPLTHL